MGISGSADEYGGGAAVSWLALNGVSLRLGGGVRGGALSAVPGANTFTIWGSGGVVFHPWQVTSSRPIGASLRADYILMYLSATRGEAGYSRPPLSGIDGYIDAEWLFAQGAEFVLGVGLEDVLAKTDIVLERGRPPIATIPPLRLVGEAGVRVQF